MEVQELAIPEVRLVNSRTFADDRGYFFEAWHKAKLAAQGLDVDFVQDNVSVSSSGVLRGLHYQNPNPQGKLVRALWGTIYDVAVDLRLSSPTFGDWVGEYLSGEDGKMLWVPEGFAHGFLVVSGEAGVLYKCSGYYSPADECALRWDDPRVAIEWPSHGGPIIVSEKDQRATWLDGATVFV